MVAKTTKKKANGRPKKIIDYDLVESLAEIQCTQAEIAATLKISVKTLQRDEKFSRIYKQGMDTGRKSLRRMQWAAAKKGNTTMLVWLGKQYLHQSDKVEQKNEQDTAFTKALNNFANAINK
jgi:hypothetical protein